MDESSLAPLQGCLYCHSEGTTVLVASRRLLFFGSEWPLLKCDHCGSVAQFDSSGDHLMGWRIRYKRVNPAARYYYVRIHLGKAGWLSAEEALRESTSGYVQRKRVQQVEDGDIDWLRPVRLQPPPPLMTPEENVYLTLRGVTLQEAPPTGLFVREDQGSVLDSGKFYVTDQKLHLLGQRRDWSHRLSDIRKVQYDETAWTVCLDAGGELLQYRGINVSDQFDAQLIAAVIQTLWQFPPTLAGE